MITLESTSPRTLDGTALREGRRGDISTAEDCAGNAAPVPVPAEGAGIDSGREREEGEGDGEDV